MKVKWQSDGVISTQKVDLSGVATKVELEEVENKIPDTSGLATKIELATVESKIPDTSGLATEKDYTEIKANRQSWRDAINQLQAQLKEEE